MDRRFTDPHQDDPWRRSVAIGANTAPFALGASVRCPATVCMPNGTPTICGGGLGTAEDALHVVVLGRASRRGIRLVRAEGSLIRQVCRRCRQSYRLVRLVAAAG